MELLRRVRAISGENMKLAFFWDSARIHKAKVVRELADELNI